VNIVRFGLNPTPTDNSHTAANYGGKGAELIRMSREGLPVPPGIVIPVSACRRYINEDTPFGKTNVMVETAAAIKPYIRDIREAYPHALFSVRSGAPVSMPGMMDTILNVGMACPEDYYESLGKFPAWECYERLLRSYGTTIRGRSAEDYDAAVRKVSMYKYGSTAKPKSMAEFSIKHYGMLRQRYESIASSHEFKTLDEQLRRSIEAVFRSWGSERASAYRREHGIDPGMGTGVVIQMMVFGNRDSESSTGVVFSRCPQTGNEGMIGEFLTRAQGEDLVAGKRTPQPIDYDTFPQFGELAKVVYNLDASRCDMQDVEFTVDSGKLWILQARTGKRSARAAFKIAHDLHAQGLALSDALKRVTADQYNALMRKVASDDGPPHHANGTPASAGLVSGVPAFTSDEAIKYKKEGTACILLRPETSPDDFEGMAAAEGLITSIGGLTSHAAVVARSMNKPCVVGAPPPSGFSEAKRITLCGSTGRIWVDVYVPTTGGVVTSEADFLYRAGVKHYAERVWLECAPDDILTGSVSPDKRVINCRNSSYEDVAAVVHELDLACATAVLDIRPSNSLWADFDCWLGRTTTTTHLNPEEVENVLNTAPHASIKLRGAVESPHEVPYIDCLGDITISSGPCVIGADLKRFLISGGYDPAHIVQDLGPELSVVDNCLNFNDMGFVIFGN